MLGEERQNEILRLLDEQNSITVQELMKIFAASESTIRRDLNYLDENGYIIKVHGGALAKDKGLKIEDSDIESRYSLNKNEKIEIARYAASLIKPGDIVYIDAGTTTELITDFVIANNVTFVTNAFSHARKLSQKGYETFVLGGEFKAVTEAIVGEEAMMCLDKYNFSKGFWGTNGVNRKNGFTTPDMKEAMIKKKSMSKTKEKYVLADSSKFSQISSVTFADFKSANIITTGLSDDSYKSAKNVINV